MFPYLLFNAFVVVVQQVVISTGNINAFEAGVILLPQHHANNAHGGWVAWRDVRGFLASFALKCHDHLKAVVKFEQDLVFHR